jgi:hypothetical protein
VFVSTEASSHARFTRAIQRENVTAAEAAAREMGWLSIENALSLVLLYGATDSAKFEAAAVRWLARLALERDGVLLADVLAAASSLVALRTASHPTASALLRELGRAAPADPRRAASFTRPQPPGHQDGAHRNGRRS